MRYDKLMRMRTRRSPWPGVLGTAAVVALAGGGFLAWASQGGLRGIDKRRPDMPTLAGGRGLRVERTVTVVRSPAELYARWRDLARLPELMAHLESVTPLDGKRSRWVARGPGDVRVTWEAELTADEPDRLIAWRSVPGSDVDNAGSVTFAEAPGARGTEVTVHLSYAPPAGRVGGAVAALLGRGGDRQVREDLRRFKQILETGEAATGARRPAEARASQPVDLPRSA